MKKTYGERYLNSVCTALSGSCGEEFIQSTEIESVNTISDAAEEIVVSISFSGTVSGSYLLSMDYECARFLLSKVSTSKDINLLYSLLAESLNIAVGEAIGVLIDDFEVITFMSPVISHSPVQYPQIDTLQMTLSHERGYSIVLFLLLDCMHLGIKKSLENAKDQKDKAEKYSRQLLQLNKAYQAEKEGAENLSKQAQEATNAKSQFLAVMSHEMRTPLNAVIGFTDILLDEPMTAEQREMLFSVKRSGDNLLSIINDVLDLTKIEAKEMEIEHISFNLEDVVFDAAEMGRSKSSNEQIEINVDLAGTQVNVIGDATKIRQIITNLVSNAVKFTEKGEVLIKVLPIFEDAEWQHLKFEVIDTGIGMTAQQCKKVFLPFKQADSSTTRKYGGTGLGLSICNGLIKTLGSRLSLISKPGKGTEFTFELKLKLTKDIERNNLITDFKNKRALIIDDNPNAARVLTHYLEKYGMKVAQYNSYSQFEEKNKEVFDIAYIDIMQPEVDGYQILEILRKNKTADKIVAITSLISSHARSQIQNSGFDTYFCKPIRPSSLINMTKRVLTNSIEEIPSSKIHQLESSALNVLVAEDNIISQKLVIKALTKMGHTVSIANNGAEAIKMVTENEYDIVFMDIQMPTMNGIEATIELRKKEAYEDLPIIAMTANAMQQSKDECLDAGMNDFITKPIKRTKIWQAFNEFCYKKDLPMLQEQPRLLVVEDDKLLRNLMKHVLNSALPNITLKFASNGMEACSLVGSLQPHLILTDIIMPNMDGIEFIKFLKSSDIFSHIDIFVQTAIEETQKLEEIKQLGVKKIFTKPFKREPMIRAIKDSLLKKMRRAF